MERVCRGGNSITVASIALLIILQVFLPYVAQGEPTLRMGIAMPHNNSRCEDVYATGALWAYDYNTSGPGCFDNQNVRMVWGAGSLLKLPVGVTGVVLEMNEPDCAPSYCSNLSPQQGAALVRQIEQRAPAAFLVAPAPSHTGLDWLPQMRDAYYAAYGVYPKWDALAMHCYSDWSDCPKMLKQYDKWAQAWGVKEIWITEYAAEMNVADEFLAYLDGWNADEGRVPVTHIAWWTTRANNEPWAIGFPVRPLLDYHTGALTAYGRWWKGQVWRPFYTPGNSHTR